MTQKDDTTTSMVDNLTFGEAIAMKAEFEAGSACPICMEEPHEQELPLLRYSLPHYLCGHFDALERRIKDLIYEKRAEERERHLQAQIVQKIEANLPGRFRGERIHNYPDQESKHFLAAKNFVGHL